MKRGTTAEGAVPRRVQGRTAPRSSGDCCKSAVSEGSRSFPTIGLFGSMPRMAAGQVAKYITGCSAPLNRNGAASDRWRVIGARHSRAMNEKAELLMATTVSEIQANE